MHDAAGGCVVSGQQAYQPARRGHCNLTLFHSVVVMFSSCIHLHIYGERLHVFCTLHLSVPLRIDLETKRGTYLKHFVWHD